jgi:hypothetical protein
MECGKTSVADVELNFKNEHIQDACLIYIPNDLEVDDLEHHTRQILGQSLEE